MNDAVTLERMPSTELIDPKVLTPAQVFSTEGGVDAVLARITAEVRAFKGDMSTAIGRKDIASFAYKVARSKTLLDKWGQELGRTHYDAWKVISNERTLIEKALDALRDEVRKPLTDWENAEQARVDAHEQALAQLIAIGGTFHLEPSVREIDAHLAELDAAPQRDWQEFTVRAAEAAEGVRKKLTALREAAVKREAERAALERLRQEAAAREQREREERIAAAAAERARQQAEEKAQAEARAAERRAALERERIEQERLRAEREKADAIARAERAEADKNAAAERAERARKEAEEKAARDQLAAIEAERKRVADSKAAEDAAAAKREANAKHVAKINKAIADALGDCAGLDTKTAHIVIAAIARGEIPHITVSY
jgi:DNA repair exonuclease SbcCD ATPase subunit